MYGGITSRWPRRSMRPPPTMGVSSNYMHVVCALVAVTNMAQLVCAHVKNVAMSRMWQVMAL